MTTTQRNLSMLALVVSGEAIFILPFVLARVFKPTVLEVFNLNNFELGSIFSVYGVVAVFAYFLGGPLADKFPARNLIVSALIATAFGGVFLATVPNYMGMQLLFGFWGITTILLFWAALIRATRELGGDKFQGIAFGFLDGGRGLVAAIIGTLTVWIFTLFLPGNIELSTLEERKIALQYVIYFMVAFILVISLLVFFLLPSKNSAQQDESEKFSLSAISKVLKLPTIWLQAIIIVCAYVGYKAIGDFSLYAKEILLFNEVESAKAGAVVLWVRPVAAILAGFIAFKIDAVKLIIGSFCIMFIGSFAFASGMVVEGKIFLYFSLLITTCTGIFAMRALYFAILEDARIPLALTGTAVGFISLIGYTPDIFMGPLMGVLLDRNPGSIIGHQHLFMVLAGFSFLGALTTILFKYHSKKNASLYLSKSQNKN